MGESERLRRHTVKFHHASLSIADSGGGVTFQTKGGWETGPAGGQMQQHMLSNMAHCSERGCGLAPQFPI